MKRNIKIVLIVAVSLIGVILLDTLQAKAFNNEPIIKITEDYNGGGIYQKHKGILVDTYIYTEGSKKTYFKWESKSDKLDINCNDNKKIMLESPHKLDIDLEKNIDRKTELWNMKSLSFNENIENKPLVDYESEYSDIINKIKEKYADFNPENWNISLNMYSDDGSGTMKFSYIIKDKILTNKSISFTIEDNIITTVYYTNISGETDEEQLIKNIDLFEETYEQTKKVMKDNEEFESEDVMYHYYYNIDKLVYIYQLYFYEIEDGQKILNNSCVSEYIVENDKVNEA